MLSLSLNSNLEGKKTGPNFGNILNHSWFYSFARGIQGPWVSFCPCKYSKIPKIILEFLKDAYPLKFIYIGSV